MVDIVAALEQGSTSSDQPHTWIPEGGYRVKQKMENPDMLIQV